MYKTIYIRKGDEVFWAWAEEKAASQGIPLTAYISQTLKNHMRAIGAKQETDPSPQELVAEARASLDRALAGLTAEAES